MEKTEDVRREIDATREQMAATAAEIEVRIHSKVDAVKQKLDLMDHARAHPWPALAIALIAGAAIAATGSDRKAATAATRVAKRAPRATGRALKAAGTGAAHLAQSAVGKLRGGHDEHDADHHGEDNGFLSRVKAKFAEQARELGEHLGRAADDLVKSSGARRSTADAPLSYDRTPGDSGIGITTPYPPTSAD